MKILQEELRIEESKLKSLQDEYKNGQPDRLGNEKIIKNIWTGFRA